MLLKDLTTVIPQCERIVMYDRFNRLIEINIVEDIPHYLMQAPVDHLFYSEFHACQAVKLRIGKFEGC